MSDVTSFEVTGDWRHIVDDGMVDGDNLPDEVPLTGKVVFKPVYPTVATAGVPVTAYTLGPVTALIAGGVLNDLQGRPGVMLAGKVGEHTVRWSAETSLRFQEQKVDYPRVTFDLTEDVRLTGIITQAGPSLTPTVVDPRIEALAASVESVNLAVVEAEGHASTAAEQVPLAKAEADRAVGLAGAQDEHVAGVLEDPQSATHAAFKAVGNATYGTKAELGQLDTDKLSKDEAAETFADKVEVAARVPAVTVPGIAPTPPPDRRVQWISTFQSGHGWAAFTPGASTIDLAYTVEKAFGSQAVRLLNAPGDAPRIDRAVTLDATDKSIVLALRIPPGSGTEYGTISISAYSGGLTANFVNWQPSADYFDDGWLFYEVNFDAVRSTGGTFNRAAIHALRVSALSGAPGEHVVGAIGLRDPHPEYPNGVITLTFDDGYDDQFDICRAKMDQYGFPGVAYLIRDLIGTPNFMTIEQLRHLQDVSGWDLCAHGDTADDHAVRYTNRTPEQQRASYRRLQEWMQANGFRGWRHYASPGGQIDNANGRIVREFFRTHRTSSTFLDTNLVAQRPGVLLPYGLLDVAVNNTNFAGILDSLPKIKAGKAWSLISFHEIDAGIGITTAQFGELIDAIAALDIPVRTVTDIMGY